LKLCQALVARMILHGRGAFGVPDMEGRYGNMIFILCALVLCATNYSILRAIFGR